MTTNKKIIIALDMPTAAEALAMAKILSGTGVKFKIGMELFYAEGRSIIEKIQKHGDVFLDLKLHDIPETMARTAAVLTQMGVWMFNVHASAGVEALQRVRDAVDETIRSPLPPLLRGAPKAGGSGARSAPLLIAVTVLTSFKDLQHLSTTKTIPDLAFDLAKITHAAKFDGVVCSPHEVALIKKLDKKFLCVTPGIRRPEDAADDQNRTATPTEALAAGSDYLVIGRPITKAKDPRQALGEMLSQIPPSPPY